MSILLKPLLICWLFSLIHFNAYSRGPETALASSIRVYPVTLHGKESADYTLTVNGIPVPVEKLEKYADAPVQYALMDVDGAVKLNFELTTRSAILKYAISPKTEKITGTALANKLEFSITKAQYIAVRIEGMDDLFILIDTLDHRAPVPGAGHIRNITGYAGIDAAGHADCTNAINKAITECSLSHDHPVLYFPPGTYLSGEIKMKDNVTVYLAGGAVIQATNNKADYPDKGVIYYNHVVNAKLTGRGIIDGNGTGIGRNTGIHIIEAVLSERCLVDGVTERDSPFWTNHIFECHDFNYKNLKILNDKPKTKVNNTDGLNFDCSSYCSLHNGFFYTGDDNCVVKGTGTGSAYNVHHIVFDKYIGYSNSAACKIGTETTIDSISHITFSNVDIIRCDRTLVIDAFDNAKISNVAFRNIYVENIAPSGEGNEASGFIEFLVTRTGWRQSAGKASINNIAVKNITIGFDINDFPSVVKGVSEIYGVNNLTFRGLKLTDPFGRHVSLKGLKQLNMQANNYVYRLNFIK